MALTSYGVNDALTVKLWAKKLWTEVLQETVMAKFIGKGPSSMIQLKEETAKNPGDRITVGLRMQLSGAGIQGDATLQDNEEALTTYSQNILIDQLRHAVRSGGKMSEQRVPFDVREEAKSGLVDWWADRIDTSLINQLAGNTVQTDQRYTGLNAVTAGDTDHIIFGGDASSVATLGSNDKMDIVLIDEAVEKARTLSPGMRPVKTLGGEYWLCFIHPYQLTDLRAATSTGQYMDIQKAAIQGGMIKDNPIFTGAAGMYNNTIIHIDKRIPLGIASGVATANTRTALFCGAQAAMVAFGRDYNSVDRFKWVEQLFDYENQLGVSAGLVWGAVKSRFNSKDFSVIQINTYTTTA